MKVLDMDLFPWASCLSLFVFIGLVESTNIALGKPVTMSSLYIPNGDWNHAVDGITSGDWYKDYSCASTKKESNPWFILDLLDTYTVTALMIYNRDDCCFDRLENLSIQFGDTQAPLEIKFFRGVLPEHYYIRFDTPYTGRYLRLSMSKREYLTICELELYVPVNGDWSDWGPFDECSVSCGTGMKSRSRTCTNPAPMHAGTGCVGNDTETVPCNEGVCPEDGGWTNFTDWSTCSESCGTGFSIGTRTCTNPTPTGSGADCVGSATKTQTCNTHDCPDSCAVMQARPPGNCNDIRVQIQTALSGEYNITLDSGQVVPVYCEFMVKQGYAFIPKSTLSSLSTLEGLYDISDHAIIRILYGNGEQHEVEVAQLSMFRDRFPLSIQLSSQIGYKRPYNWIMKPYLYLGFMPRNYTILKSKMTRSKPFQGYWAGQGNVIFKNFCKRPDSYIAFFGNDGNETEHTYSKTCCNSATVRAWFLRALLIPETRYLNPNYFIFYEMSMGGAGKCGGYFTSRHGKIYSIRGAALGLGFEYKDCKP